MGATTALAAAIRSVAAGAAFADIVDPRPTIAVTINGRGPFRLIADSAAEGIGLSRSVADTLQLPETAQAMTIIGSTGSVPRGARHIEHLDSEDLHWTDRPAAILDRHALPAADGILGLAGLPDLISHYRFHARTASVRARVPASGISATTTPPMRLPITLRKGGVPVINMQLRDARGRTQRLQAVIDTGAERSVGTAALSKVAGKPSSSATPLRSRTLTGASGETILGTEILIGALRLGAIEWAPTVITCAALPVFRDWGLDAAPALLLGIDLLSHLEALSIDNDRREVLVTRG